MRVGRGVVVEPDDLSREQIDHLCSVNSTRTRRGDEVNYLSTTRQVIRFGTVAVVTNQSARVMKEVLSCWKRRKWMTHLQLGEESKTREGLQPSPGRLDGLHHAMAAMKPSQGEFHYQTLGLTRMASRVLQLQLRCSHAGRGCLLLEPLVLQSLRLMGLSHIVLAWTG